MSLNVDREGGFAERQIVGLSDKIPLVKPYLKKKQRKLDPKCLHHALEDPILTTLLSTDSLVSGDGMFVPRNAQDGLLDVSRAGVPGLVTQDGDVEIADTSVELEETRQQTEPKIGDPIPNGHCFQPKPVVRAAGNKVATSPGRDVPPVVTSQTPHQEGGVMKHALLTSVAQTLPVKDCSSVQDCHPLNVQPDKGVLFQDKSEEASLDLVFELLTQLQYHTHQSDSVDICII
ncbi:TCDD-inducible poly [ADP-ribose] polymerase [Takifugu flavidus]|uniref:TCDD-inducible poly [ADP-ribose] polymerase n=1 Tax=Takifugu flavidus TaxID=433684 RepID=A0A5C6PE00_9TELE|nr:TCDD-inducible poly [ADP-ribose] polymerase [Takifugu flavidus]